MVKFKFTPSRFAEACNILEYQMMLAGHKQTAMRIAPRFVLGEDGEYIVTVKLDEEGDVEGYENVTEAMQRLGAVTPKRFDKLLGEMVEAAKSIVNPPKGGGSETPSSQAQK